MADDHGHGDIIIVKKKISGGGGHHGGAWKIAFADFMTAMMAFFLVLWIINATDKDTKTVIARYFNPVKLENPSKSKKGVHGDTTAPADAKEDKSDKDANASGKDKEAKGAPAKPEADAQKTPTADAKALMAEANLFASPYETLDRIAGAPSRASPGASPDIGDADPQRLAGALSIDSFRDPFKPIGPGAPDDPAAFDASAANNAPRDLEPAKTGASGKPNPEAAPKGAEKQGAAEAAHPAPAPDKAAESAKSADKLEKEIKQSVKAALGAAAGPNVEVRQTAEGLLISLTDKLDFAMFSVGSAEPRPELVRAFAALAKVVGKTPGSIVVRGHTDARPYKNGAYDNWRLSSERAQMAYYMLTRGGADAARFIRVEGYADRALKDPAQPLAAVNRRLEILVRETKP